MTNRFESKVVLVTGGNSGIGQAIAVAFAKEGAKVVVAARRASEGNETVAMIEELGGQAHFVPTDVSKTTEVKAMIAACITEYGGLDYAVNNAGIEGTPLVQTTDYEEEVWDRVIDINLKGVWLCMKYEIPEMLKRGHGAIVNMSSVARADRRASRSRLLCQQAWSYWSNQGRGDRIRDTGFENQRSVSGHYRNSHGGARVFRQ